MDGVAEAWKRIESGFDVREGHGRLESNWFTREARPPDMRVNVVVDAARGIPPVTGEVQVHLLPILKVKEDVLHRLHEIVRDATGEALLRSAGDIDAARAAALTSVSGPRRDRPPPRARRTRARARGPDRIAAARRSPPPRREHDAIELGRGRRRRRG